MSILVCFLFPQSPLTWLKSILNWLSKIRKLQGTTGASVSFTSWPTCFAYWETFHVIETKLNVLSATFHSVGLVSDLLQNQLQVLLVFWAEVFHPLLTE